MPTTLKTQKARTPAAAAGPKRTAKTTAKPPATAVAGKRKGESLSLAEVMRTLEKAGSAQTRKTYTRHGATGPMFGVSFATLGALQKRIRVDHRLALQLWDTGNVDARNLAMKIADPAAITSADLDRWARENPMLMCGLYVASLAQESPHGAAKVTQWLASSDERLRIAGWTLVAVLASRDEQSPDETFAKHLATIEKSIHSAANRVKYAMNSALIGIGGRSAGLRKAATAAAKRIGKVDVDHGDTSCKTPDAVEYIDMMWRRCGPKFPSPAAAERARDSMRTRC
jgi:3-methyladenine DNA glycosylase AlkD